MYKIKLLLLSICLLTSQHLFSQAYIVGDISAMPFMMANHDSTQCASFAMEQYNVTISNSFVGDQLIFKDQFSGNVLITETNTSGANPWTIVVNPMSMMPFVPDDMIISGFANFTGFPMKIISGPDTIYNVLSSAMLQVLNPCQYDNVSGRVYVDNNSDCMYNTGDIALHSVPILSTGSWSSGGSGNYGYSDALGNYSIKMQESWLNSYTVSLPPFYQFIFPSTFCSPTSYTYTTLPQSNVDFSLQCTSNIDVQASMSLPGNARPAMPFMLHPIVSNTGCNLASGTLTLVKDANTIYNASLSTNPASYVNGDTLQWNYTNLTNLSAGSYWNSFMAGVHLTPNLSVSIGDTLCFSLSTTLSTGDVNLANNQHSICIPVVNSYDPNVKEVSPKGLGANGDVPLTTSQFDYTIHFQNTGNAVAYNIYVLDTLDADFDKSTFRIIGASHAMTPEWVAPNVVKFNFYNIMLPDSMSNEAASHGQIRYNVKRLPSATLGTQFKNTAHIFFDSNPAIVTNTTINTLATPQKVDEVLRTNLYSIYPNPSQDKLFIECIDNRVTEVTLYDALSKIVAHVKSNNKKMEIDMTALSKGIYFVSIHNNEGTTNHKVVKQ